MFQTNFDDLENSLIATLELMRKKELLEASGTRAGEVRKSQLRRQLEDQAFILSRMKDHYREIKDDPRWEPLSRIAQSLLKIQRLFNEEESGQFQRFRAQINELINDKLSEIDYSLNERIINNGFDKADRSRQVKIYRNWTSA